MRLSSPSSRAECHEIWEPKPPGTLWATPGLLRDSITFLMVLSTTQIFIALHQQPNKTENDVFRNNMHSGVHHFQNVMWCHRTCISVISLIPITKVRPPSTALYCTETHNCATVQHAALLRSFSRKLDSNRGKHGFQCTHFYTTHDHSINLCGQFSYQFFFNSKVDRKLENCGEKI